MKSISVIFARCFLFLSLGLVVVGKPAILHADTNLVPNPSVEQANGNLPANWSTSRWGTNTTQFTHESSGAQDGLRSLKVEMTAFSSGDAKWYFQPVLVKPSTEYAFVHYYQSNVATKLEGKLTKTDGSVAYLNLGTLSSQSGWTQNSVSFTTPSNAKEITIYQLIRSVGILRTDAYFLQEVEPPGVEGNVPNSSLEQFSVSNPNQPLSWRTSRYGSNNAVFSYLSSGHTGTKSVKTEITSYSSGDAKWYYAPQPIAPNQLFQFTDWYKSSLSSRVYAVVTKTDGTTQYIRLANAPASSSWTKYSDTFTTPSNASTLTIHHQIQGVGYLTVDDYAVTEYVPSTFNRALVSLTFDDGYRSVYDSALPLLTRYNVPSTQYLVSGYLGFSRYMTRAQVEQFRDAGHQLAGHTVNHARLTDLSDTAIVYQLTQSQNDLESWFGVPIEDFASPFGAYNDRTVGFIRQYYRTHRSVESGYNTKQSITVNNLKVQNLYNTTTVSEVRGWLQQAKNDKSWLILVCHEVLVGGDRYSVTPANLEKFLQEINASQVQATTVDQALDELLPQL